MSKVTRLHEVANFSHVPLALKLRFRVSLCLARIYVARGEHAKARECLDEHAEAAFAMLSQANNRPLFSIGWLYLASILTALCEDSMRAAWAWSKVQLFQPTRWRSIDFYGKCSDVENNPPLEASVRTKLDAIKSGEEYTFYDGTLLDFVGSIWPDDFNLPCSVTLACDGRNCHATSKTEEHRSRMQSEPLQMTQGLGFTTVFPPAQEHVDMRVAFRVCRDCMLSKLCVTCYTRLQKGKLPPTGCSPSHSAVFVPGWDDEVLSDGFWDDEVLSDGASDDEAHSDGVSDDETFAYNATKKDLEIVAEESRKWNINLIGSER